MVKIITGSIILSVVLLAGCAAIKPGYVQKSPPPPNSPVIAYNQNVIPLDYGPYALYYTSLVYSYYPASVGIDAGESYGPGTLHYNPTSYYGGF